MSMKLTITIFSVDNLEKFVNDLLDGKLEAYLKSEPIPEDNDAAVKVSFLSLQYTLAIIYFCLAQS